MDKRIKEIVERIVHIPHDFNHGDKSELALLEESGYFKIHQQITEEVIKEVLKKYPNVIVEWLQLSEDSRSSTRWCFWKNENGKYFVGHWPDSKDFEEVNTTDEFYACAVFIKRKAESIRILFKK